ncbi:MAG: sulfite exporter TauE/SafE family protein [Gemmatimonadaceae bacterium]|jgi:hypothetical protein|nr:sulfite exporter TauE/SafE family protein [Gemmatimonadaceae bacterium]
MPLSLIAAVAALAIGLSLGMLGGGGSVLTVPALVYLVGVAPKSAIAMSLPVVGTASLIGAVGHWRAGNVDLRTALGFGAVAMAGAVVGTRLATFFTDAAQLLLLGVVMLASALSMLRGGARPPRHESTPLGRALLPLVALGVGALTGLVGVGGGFLVVPALVVLAGIPMTQAIGTSLVVIAMNTATSFAATVGRVPIDWRLVASFTALACVGIVLGTRLVRHVAQTTLRRAFAVLLLVIAVLLVIQNRGALFG